MPRAYSNSQLAINRMDQNNIVSSKRYIYCPTETLFFRGFPLSDLANQYPETYARPTFRKLVLAYPRASLRLPLQECQVGSPQTHLPPFPQLLAQNP